MEIFTLGERLMIYRKRAGLTKTQLAEMAHVTVSSITKYENDVMMPDDDTMLKLSLILNVSSNRIMFGFDDPAKDMPKASLIKDKNKEDNAKEQNPQV